MISPMRHATIVTSHLTESIKFYEHVLGMSIFYDNVLDTKADSVLVGFTKDVHNRLVSMQQGDHTFGMVGLMHFYEPIMRVPPLAKQEGLPYPVSFSFGVDDVERVSELVRETGAPIVGPVRTVIIPDRGPVVGMSCVDPNGVLVDFNQFAPGRRGIHGRNPTPVRRITIPVPHGMMNESIAFYRNVLDMQIYYDQVIAVDESSTHLGVGAYRARLVCLQQGSSTSGMVGLIEFYDPAMDVRPLVRADGLPYPLAFVFLVDSMAEVYARVVASGAREIGPPQYYQIPARGPAIGMTCLDPNGVLLDLTQLPRAHWYKQSAPAAGVTSRQSG